MRQLLVIGLGNPGQQYFRTRHNLGFWAVDLLSERLESTWRKPQGKALVSAASYGEWKLILAKPTTFMNLSGEAVIDLIQKHHCAVHDLLVVCDDVNLPVGKMRIRKEGSAGGHHGLESILESVGSAKFSRIRLGVKPLDSELPRNLDQFVLERFPKGEEALVAETVKRSVEAVLSILDDGMEAAMSRYN